jgi:uncharacterized protein
LISLSAFTWTLLGNFVDTFFSRFSELQAASRHGKWQEINLAATLPGWKRFKPAERWLRNSQPRETGTNLTGSVSQPGTSRRTASEVRGVEAERLFEEFLLWREQRGRR